MTTITYLENGVKAEKRRKLSVDGARSQFHYNPLTGALIWKINKSGARIGARAGSLDTKGHRRIYCEGKTYASTHIIWAIVHGRWPNAEIDHRNLVRDDDSLDNLGEASPSQNCANRGRVDGRLKGVSFHKPSGKFHARVTRDRKTHFLGVFADQNLADMAYDAAAVAFHGEFALTNAGVTR